MALALGNRRSTIAAVGSAIAAIALAAAVAGRSCSVAPPGPDVAVRDLVRAAKTGDRDAVYDLLSPATQAHLEAEAKHATDLVGAAVRYTAKDLISIGASQGDGTGPTDITVISQEGDHAIVEVVSAAGRSRLSLVRVAGAWRVDLPDYPDSSAGTSPSTR